MRLVTAPEQSALFEDASGDAERLTPEQARAVDARAGSRLLHANAGSGKTTVVVERFARAVVDDGLDPRRILAITFTEKAAGEMKTKIRQVVAAEVARATDETRPRWTRVRRELLGAQISTIHAFCARVCISRFTAAFAAISS